MPTRIYPGTRLDLPSLVAAASGTVGGAAVENQSYLILADTPLDGATWLNASNVLIYPWTNAGGDWRDSTETAQGTSHYGSVSVSATGAQTADVAALVTKWLLSGNTGLHLQSVSGPVINIASRSSTDPVPSLSVVTSVGTFTCPCLASIWIDASSGNPLQGNVTKPTTLMRFDLAGVSGTVSSATLSFYVSTIYSGSLPAVLKINRLDVQTVVTSPETQLPPVVAGWSSTLANEAAVRASANSLWCPRMDSNANIRADWSSVHPLPGPGNVCNNPQFVTGDGWDAYGLTALRIECTTTASTLLTWRQLTTEAQRVGLDGSGPVIGTTEYTELYVRYMLRINPDVFVGMNEAGIKLPGFETMTDYVGGNGFSLRLEHRAPSVANSHDYRLTGYFYGGGDGVLSRYNNPARGGIPVTDTCLKDGRVYCIEQRVKLNTIRNTVVGTNLDGNTYSTDPDGVLQVWVNGARVFNYTGVINDTVPGLKVGTFFASIFHGGSGTPTIPIHIDFGGCVISQSYIGPPKPIDPAWRVGLTLNTFSAIANSSLSPLSHSDNYDVWCGLAASPTTLYSVANGGHTSTYAWVNAAFGLDLSQDVPAWVTLFAGSNFADVPGPSVGARYYNDSPVPRPCARHGYYSDQYNASRNRVMLFGAGGNYGPGSSTWQVDGYNLSTNDYDAAGTYIDLPVPSGFSPIALTMARNPATDDQYIPFTDAGGTRQLLKWTSASNTWNYAPGAISIFSERWSYTGCLIDVARNRCVIRLNNSNTSDGGDTTSLGFLDLTSGAYTTLATTLPAAGQYNQIVHDTINDYYYAMQGTTLYKVHPTTGVTTTAATGLPLATNGILNKILYMPRYRGIVFYPSYAESVYFMPTSA